MAKYIFELSGENLELAIAELTALFEIEKSKLRVIKQFDNFILGESSMSEANVSRLMERSSLIKKSAILIRETPSLLLQELDKVKWSFVKPPFCVRVDDLTGMARANIEARLAGPIYDYYIHHNSKPELIVSLENPKTTVLFILTDKRVYISKQLWKADKGRFLQREPIKKPAFHPTSLKPKLARLLINLSRVKSKQMLLDPFCGTGSVLIEASILGANPIGIDMDKEMIAGSEKNLKFYKQKAWLLPGNALELQKNFRSNSIDAIATDPPYGRSTKVGAKSLKSLYKGFIKSSCDILKPSGHLSMLYPHYVKVRSLINRKHWKIIFESEMYVHGGLTRKFLVLQKR